MKLIIHGVLEWQTKDSTVDITLSQCDVFHSLRVQSSKTRASLSGFGPVSSVGTKTLCVMTSFFLEACTNGTSGQPHCSMPMVAFLLKKSQSCRKRGFLRNLVPVGRPKVFSKVNLLTLQMLFRFDKQMFSYMCGVFVHNSSEFWGMCCICSIQQAFTIHLQVKLQNRVLKLMDCL